MTLNSDYIKSRIDSVRDKIGRVVTFYTANIPTEYVASGYYDPMLDTAYNVTGSELTATEVLARVHWAGDERITMAPGGKYYVGDCTLGIDPEYHALAQEAMKESNYVMVDDRKMTITKIDPRGAPSINRILLVCKSTGAKPDPL